MAAISTPEAKIALGMGSTWGTARDLTASNVGKILNVTSCDWSANFGQFDPPDTGFDNFFTAAVQLQLDVQMSMSGSFTTEGAWIQLFAAFMGTATSVPAETTGGQGDYLHNIDMASSLIGKYVSLAALIEDDYVVEIPSAKVTSFRMGGTVNGVPTWSATLIADKIVPTTNTPSNTAAEVAALAVSTYNPIAYGNTNHYFRLNSQSGGALSGGIEILEWSLELTRAFQTRFALRGANSKYTKEPLQLSPTVGQLSFKLAEIDDSVIDMFPDYLAANEKKAELFIDGTAIGSGVNRSMKLQFPRLFPLPPSGYGIPNNASLMQPTLNYRLLKASAAPTGMTGVTNYLRGAFINTRVQSYFN